MNKVFVRFMVKSINPKIRVTFDEEQESYFDFNATRINFGYDFGEVELGFRRHIKEVHHFKKAFDYSLHLWTILHEIGHYYTQDLVDEDEDDLNMRATLGCVSSDGALDEKIQDLYFNLPYEWAATDWAIIYIIQHPKRVKVMEKILTSIVK